MKKLRTVVSVIIMAIAAVVGFFIGSAVSGSDGGFGCAILLALISGIACIVYAIDNRKN